MLNATGIHPCLAPDAIYKRRLVRKAFEHLRLSRRRTTRLQQLQIEQHKFAQNNTAKVTWKILKEFLNIGRSFTAPFAFESRADLFNEDGV